MQFRWIVTVLILVTVVMAIPSMHAQDRRAASSQYDRAYLIGFNDGARDGRRGQAFEYDHETQLRRATIEYRRGYTDGYRDGYVRNRRGSLDMRPRGEHGGPLPGSRRGAISDPAFSRGQSEGFRQGFEDGRGRNRYDPVRHREYRDGDAGYFSGYGTRDGYRNNYRDGFRQGYEEGYREGSRSSKR
jgi:hypothetical protein